MANKLVIVDAKPVTINQVKKKNVKDNIFEKLKRSQR